MSDPSFSSALRRIKGNDRILTQLQLMLSEPPIASRREEPRLEVTYIKDGDGPGLERICDAIGRNSHLRDVSFEFPLFSNDVVAQSSHFDGLRKNKSIRSLGLSQCELGHGVGREVLKAFEENNGRLTKFVMWQCAINYRGPDTLAATLAKCTRLKFICLLSCGIDDHIVAKLAAGLKGHRDLTALYLPGNRIQRAGCQALATVLRDPECSLVDLDLHNNMIDNFGAKAVADALAENQKLETVCLDENYITADGWDSYIHILCNTSSITATYTSNHTLRKIAFFEGVNIPGSRIPDDDYAIPNRLVELITLNGGANGSDPERRRINVARQKILDVHIRGNFDMAPFAEGSMDMRRLPHVLSWMGRPCSIPRYNAAGRTAVYELLRQNPTVCSMSCAIKGSVEGFVENQRGTTRNHDGATGHRGEHYLSGCKSILGSLVAKAPRPFKTLKTPKLSISLCRH